MSHSLSDVTQAGADLEAKDKRGWTALFHATYNGHQNVVKFLLHSGADMNCAYVYRVHVSYAGSIPR